MLLLVLLRSPGGKNAKVTQPNSRIKIHMYEHLPQKPVFLISKKQILLSILYILYCVYYIWLITVYKYYTCIERGPVGNIHLSVSIGNSRRERWCLHLLIFLHFLTLCTSTASKIINGAWKRRVLSQELQNGNSRAVLSSGRALLSVGGLPCTVRLSGGFRRPFLWQKPMRQELLFSTQKLSI